MDNNYEKETIQYDPASLKSLISNYMTSPIAVCYTDQQPRATTNCKVLLKISRLQLMTLRENFNICSVKAAFAKLDVEAGIEQPLDRADAVIQI
ncbi:unnamed protein product [Clavelina lepadiformis]|uniref:Uncharacterized protein n=1 Tax=Clavelina lepadiformis TaxID=159417 RepID=A0ABP0H2V8_CLALP